MEGWNPFQNPDPGWHICPVMDQQEQGKIKENIVIILLQRNPPVGAGTHTLPD